MNKIAAVIVAGAMAVALAACGSAEQAVTSTAVPSAAGAPRSGFGFTATSVLLDGPNYSIEVPQVEGGKVAARTEFDDGMRALAQPYIRRAGPGVKVTGFRSEVCRMGEHVLSGLLRIEIDTSGPHPNSFYNTHVTDVDTGKALTLPDLFTDIDAGVHALSEQAAVLVPRTRAGAYFDQNGIAPVEQNFQTWVATPEGMRIYLGEIASHAQGNIDITVPWSALDGVLKPGLRAVLSS